LGKRRERRGSQRASVGAVRDRFEVVAVGVKDEGAVGEPSSPFILAWLAAVIDRNPPTPASIGGGPGWSAANRTYNGG
jgi:hypothetical protein